MKKVLLLAFVAVLAIGFLTMPAANAQTRNVTFVLNTATIPDTVISTAALTGASQGNGATGRNPRVDSLLTSFGAGRALTKIGGDYWRITLPFQQGDSARFKFRVNGGWENNTVDPNGISSDNRGLIVGNADTTLPVQFYNVGPSSNAQYFRPWTAVPDSVLTIWFRVNMQGTNQVFNKNTDTVGIRGDKKGGSFNDPGFGWSPTRYLTRESSAGGFSYDGTNFWSGAIRLRKSNVNAGDSIGYKYIIGYDWGRNDANDRFTRIPIGKKDTTIAWVWYNNEAPTPPPAFTDTCLITFRVNMSTAITRGGFAIGDTVQVQTGFFGTANQNARTKTLLRQGLTNFYQAQDSVITRVTNTLDYQYYIVKNGISIRENYYNFQWAGAAGAQEAERRQIPVSSKLFTVQDTVSDISAARRQPEFPNQSKFTKGVKVTWTVNLKPAYYQVKLDGSILPAINSTIDSIKLSNLDSIKNWGVVIQGPGVGGVNGPLAIDWASWGRPIAADTSKRRMWDDGPGGGHGDAVANDTIYSVFYRYTTNNIKGAVFKFGIRGSDNESGFGLNHLENLSDADTVYTVAAQWGSINPKFYKRWDYNLQKPILTGVEELPGVAQVYALEQNYPNPFNPSTKIEFAIPVTSNVTLKVFNILGQEVATLVNETLNVGRHRVLFDAAKFASGVYIYKITAGNFVSTKKMLLLK